MLHSGDGNVGKRSRRRRGRRHRFPVATVMYYGPDDRAAAKVAVGIVRSPGGEPVALRRWYAREVDKDSSVQREIAAFISRQGARTVLVSDGVAGCPHEEGIDYPEGEECPHCPFWRGRKGSGRLTPSTLEAGEKRGSMPPLAVASYSREQWQRLREVAVDRDHLEANWEEWQRVKKREVARLRREGFHVHEMAVDVDALEEYCRHRGLVIDSSARAEYAAYRMQVELDGGDLEE